MKKTVYLCVFKKGHNYFLEVGDIDSSSIVGTASVNGMAGLKRAAEMIEKALKIAAPEIEVYHGEGSLDDDRKFLAEKRAEVEAENEERKKYEY